MINVSNIKERKLGVLLPTRGILMRGNQPDNIKSILKMAERVEEAGLDSVWVGDSLTAKPRLEPLTALSAISQVTSKVRLGTAVLLAPLRHPVSLAQAATTVDLISEGRLVLGMGVGGAFNEEQRMEWENVGVQPRHRAGRFEELLKVFKPLTRGESVTFEGKYFSVNDVSIMPVSPQPNGVPVVVAAHGRLNSDRQYRRVLLGDGSISISDFPDEYSKSLLGIDAMMENEMKQYQGQMEKIYYMTVNLNTDPSRAREEADEFLRLYYGINIWDERWGPWGSCLETVTRMNEYFEAGADTVIVRFASFDQESNLERFLSEVAPFVLV